ncbi:hypothetical protein ACHAWF_002593 [Thalassiosira exigua]
MCPTSHWRVVTLVERKGLGVRERNVLSLGVHPMVHLQVLQLDAGVLPEEAVRAVGKSLVVRSQLRSRDAWIALIHRYHQRVRAEGWSGLGQVLHTAQSWPRKIERTKRMRGQCADAMRSEQRQKLMSSVPSAPAPARPPSSI